MPLRGSFQELADLFREYALKYEADDVGRAVDAAALVRPTVDMLASELEEAGFNFVDADLRPSTLRFPSGRALFEDPSARLLFLPEIRHNLNLPDLDKPLAYARDAIDKYWSDGTFELTVNVGCVSGRRIA
jgi:hypothetical protein